MHARENDENKVDVAERILQTRKKDDIESDNPEMVVSKEVIVQILANIQNSTDLIGNLNILYEYFDRVRMDEEFYDMFLNLIQLIHPNFSLSNEIRCKIIDILWCVITDGTMFSFLIDFHKIHEWLWEQFDNIAIEAIICLINQETKYKLPKGEEYIVYSYISQHDGDQKISSLLIQLIENPAPILSRKQVFYFIRRLAFYKQSYLFYPNLIKTLLRITVESTDEELVSNSYEMLSLFAGRSKESAKLFYTNLDLINQILALPCNSNVYIDAINVIIFPLQKANFENVPFQLTNLLIEYCFQHLQNIGPELPKILQILKVAAKFKVNEDITGGDFMVDNNYFEVLMNMAQTDVDFRTKVSIIRLLISISTNASYERNLYLIQNNFLSFIEDNVTTIIDECVGDLFKLFYSLLYQATENHNEDIYNFVIENDEIIEAIEKYDDMNDSDPRTNGDLAHCIKTWLKDYGYEDI